jgi:hypothetical protein
VIFAGKIFPDEFGFSQEKIKRVLGGMNTGKGLDRKNG